MNNTFEEFIASAKTFSLQEEEKRAILNNVSAFMESNPLPDVLPSPSSSIPTPYVSLFFTAKIKRFMPLAVLTLLVVGGGMSFAANFALPGDLLYPIKTHVNESLKSFMAFGADANAKVEADLANERLVETEKLAVHGVITPEAKNQIDTNLNTHLDNLNVLTKDMKAKGNSRGALQVDSSLEASLETHSVIINNISASHIKDHQNLDEINALVNTRLSEIVQNRTKDENDSSQSGDNGDTIDKKEDKKDESMHPNQGLKVETHDDSKALLVPKLGL